jgi:hypothetical protein
LRTERLSVDALRGDRAVLRERMAAAASADGAVQALIVDAETRADLSVLARVTATRFF